MTSVYALRTLLFYLVYIPIVVIYSLLSCTLFAPLPFHLRQTLVTGGNFMIVHWLRIACGVRFEIRGEENLPPCPYVAISNHQSAWETYFLQRRLRPVSTILKRELLRVPFFGWALATMRPIAIDRSSPRQALRQILAQGVTRLGDGINVVVYPEGTRMAPGEKGKFGRSGAALAQAADVPIVPIAHNAGLCWPPRRLIKYPGTITLVIGPVIHPGGRDSKELTRIVENWIEETLETLG